MEMPGSCTACGEERMVLDEIHGVLACDACGTVSNQTETELGSEFQTGHVIERRGTYVGETDTGVAAAKGLMRGQIASHSFFAGYPRWGERHRMETMKKVEAITALLRVPGDKVDQAKQLLDSTLKGDWGMGRWVDILVAACVYIVIRQSQLPLTVPEVADCVNCDVVELGRMYNRVLLQQGISLPNVDAFVFLERVSSTLPAFQKLEKDLVRKMKKQAAVLLDYSQECFITTGRRPLPVVAAVLTLVVEANEVVVGLEDLARELHAGMWATKKRYRECQASMGMWSFTTGLGAFVREMFTPVMFETATLIGIGKSLPWGKDITTKTLPRHLPFLLQYVELKVKLEKKKRRTCPEGEQPSRCLAISPRGQQPSTVPQTSTAFGATDQVHSETSNTRTSSPEELRNSSKRPFDSVFTGPLARASLAGYEGRLRSISNEGYQQSGAASETSSAPLLYERSKKLLKMTEVSCRGGPENVHVRSNGNISIEVNFGSADNDHEPVEDSSGITQPESVTLDINAQSDAAQVASEQILEQDKWEALPAAFCANQAARTRRRVKMDLARKRIAEARNRLKKRFGKGSVDSSVPVQSIQEQSKPNAELSREPNESLDWEDLLIERLFLRGASEAELENGYYRSLLALYPEQQDTELPNDDDCGSYIRSRSEVELLLQIRGRRDGSVTIQCPTPLSSLPPQ